MGRVKGMKKVDGEWVLPEGYVYAKYRRRKARAAEPEKEPEKPGRPVIPVNESEFLDQENITSIRHPVTVQVLYHDGSKETLNAGAVPRYRTPGVLTIFCNNGEVVEIAPSSAKRISWKVDGLNERRKPGGRKESSDGN